MSDMFRKSFRIRLPLLWLLLVWPLAAVAQVSESFVRLSENADGKPQALEVAIARYQDRQGRRVDLVGAIHVAERDYYQALNRRFAGYDRVLYELVGDPDGEELPASPALAVVGLMQGGMKEALGLTFQLDEVDYDQPHFVHADMTAREFGQRMAERNESMFGTMMQLWAMSVAAEASGAQSSNAMLLRVLLASDRRQAFKRVLAESLVDQQFFFEALSGDGGSTLITERNIKALEVLEAELRAGHTELALFYGAGHLPDFHRRLVGEYDFEQTRVEWLTAWRFGAESSR